MREELILKVTKDGMALKDVPEREKNDYLEKIAVLRTPKAIAFVREVTPDLLVLAEMGLPDRVRRDNKVKKELAEAIKKKKGGYQKLLARDITRSEKNALLGWIPEEHRTYQICYTAVCTNGHNLKYVPEEMRDELMCTRAILTNNVVRKMVKVPITEAMKIATAIGDPRIAKKYVEESERDRVKYSLKMTGHMFARLFELEQKKRVKPTKKRG